MRHFEGLTFLRWGEREKYPVWIDRVFEGYYCVQYNHSGVLRLSVDGGPLMRFAGPTAFRTFPGPHFHYGSPVSTSRHHCYIAFSGPRVKRFIADGLFPLDATPVRIRQVDRFRSAITELLTCLDREPDNADRATHLLEGVLLQMQRQRRRPSKSDPVRAGIESLARKIRNEPFDSWDFVAEADALHVSAGHFRRLFGRHVGHPPRQYLIRCRVEGASALLRDTDLPIKQIALDAGFSDVYHFTRHFSRRFQMPPGRYRREFRE